MLMIDYMKNQMGLLFDLSLVHPDRAGLQLPQVSPHRPVGKQGTDVFLVARPLLLFDGLERLFNLSDRLLPGGLVLFGLLGIVNQNEPAASFTGADNQHSL